METTDDSHEAMSTWVAFFIRNWAGADDLAQGGCNGPLLEEPSSVLGANQEPPSHAMAEEDRPCLKPSRTEGFDLLEGFRSASDE